MFRVHLFGQPELFDADGQPQSVRTATSLYLLAFLCRHPDEVFARDRVAGVLWPDFAESRARQNFRQALHHLLQVLEPGADDKGTYLDVDRQTVRLKTGTPLWVDVEAFERHLQRADDEVDADRAHHLESAMALYRGDFLESCDKDWCIEEREFLKARYVEALERMIDLAVERGARADAIAYAQEILSHNAVREDVHRRLMALHYEHGARADALKQYQRCRRRLMDDLGVAPESETERLYRAIEANAPLDRVNRAERARAPSNLPHLLTRFVGRGEEIDGLIELLGAERLVTLTGAGGCGKTRLAIEVGHRLKARLTGGVWFIDLAPLTDPHWVPQAIASTLKLPQTKIQAVTDELIEHFQSGPTLLVLDNCEHLVDACARLARRLLEACPELSILATSREPLRLSGERTWTLQPFPVPQQDGSPDDLKRYAIVRMFLDHARGYRPDFRLTAGDADAVAAICRASEGIPLAVELAVTWLRVLSSEEIAERLAHDLEMFTAQTRDVPARHRSMEAVFEHSWALLSERQRRLFRRLSVFRGGFTRKAAEAVADASLMQLAALLDKSLLYRDGDGRYSFHELLRQFAEAKLDAAGEVDRMRERHLYYVLDLAETAEANLAGAEQGPWLRCLSAEADNLRAALDWALATERAEQALRLAAALSRFWNVRGYLTEGRQWLDQALAQLDSASWATQAKALHQAGELAWRQGDYEHAERCQRKGLEIYRQLEEQAGIAQTLVGIGRVAHEQGRLREATELFEQSLAVARKLGDRRGTAVALGNLGEVRLEQGDPQGARDDLQRSLEILRELGDRAAVCNVLNNLGYVASVQGEIDDARACLNESLEMAREVDDKRGIAMALGNLGNLALEQADWDRAADSLGEIAQIFREMNDRRNLSVALNKLGQVAWEQRDHAQAREYFRESLSICHAMNDQLAVAEALCGLAEVMHAEGNSEEAARLHGTIASVLERVGATLQAHERRLYERTAEALQASLSADVYRDWVEQGRRDDLDDAIDRVPFDD